MQMTICTSDHSFNAVFSPPTSAALRLAIGEPYMRLDDELVGWLWDEASGLAELAEFQRRFFQGSRSGLVRLLVAAHSWHGDEGFEHPIYAWLCAKVWTEGKRTSALVEYGLEDAGIDTHSLLCALTAHRCSSAIMTEEELEAYAALPEGFTVWRGGAGDRSTLRMGHSWSLDRKVAEWFATRHSERTGEVGRVIWRRIRKKQIVALFTDRSEKEIVLWPSDYGFRESKKSQGAA